ncbi:MAG: hypothetical protein AAGG09_19645 [Pseudomonadota bacterium]
MAVHRFPARSGGRPRLDAARGAALIALVGLLGCGQPAPPYAEPLPMPERATAGGGAGAVATGGRTVRVPASSPFQRQPFPPAPPSAAPQPSLGVDNSRTEQAIGALEGRVDENRFGRASDCRAGGGTFTNTGCLPN